MPEATGLLAVWMQVDPSQEDNLNMWYREEHLQERAAIPGFLSAVRYLSTSGEPKYMAVYDLKSPEVLHVEPYASIRRNPSAWTESATRDLIQNIRHEYKLQHEAGSMPTAPAPSIVLLRFGVDPDDEAEFKAWHDDYLDALEAVPGVLRTRRFEAVDASPKYLAFYELESADVTQSEAWRAASMNPMADAMRSHMRDAVPSQGNYLEGGLTGNEGKPPLEP